MLSIIIISISLIIIFLILLKITKHTIKALFYIFILIIVSTAILGLFIIEDAKDLGRLNTETSLFILKDENTIKSAIPIDFSKEYQGEQENIEKIQELYNKNEFLPLKTQYFKVFIFDINSFQTTLSDEIIYNEDTILKKEDILKELYNEDDEKRNNAFIIAATDSLAFTTTEKLSSFIKAYKNKEIIIHSPILAITILSNIPTKIIETVKIDISLGKK